ncbi:MAG TPA: NUDIX hydrolase [Candidatus Dormibacteraeota bacterium]|nr:NUDIX hydrolase [Candidatus Dormibacteraeota bacterium]
MAPTELEPEVLILSQEHFSGRRIRITVDRVRLQGGREAEREVVHHPGGVGVVALQDDGSVVLVRQYRHAAQELLWEIPAGGREPGESPLETARRELAEETGYAAESWLGVGATFLAPGYSTELFWYFRATGLTQVKGVAPDPDEILQTRAFTPAGVAELANHGLLRDAKTLAGLALAGALDLGAREEGSGEAPGLPSGDPRLGKLD